MSTTFTPEQLAVIEQTRQEWIAAGKSTTRIDRDKASAALADAYAQEGMECPPIIFEPSPRSAAHTIARYLAAWEVLERKCTTAQLHELAARTTPEQAKPYLPQWHDGCLGGNTWAGWHGWVDAMRRTGMNGIEKAAAVNAVAREVHLWWPYEQLVVVCERPTALRLDDQDRLHGEGVPALEYEDGFGLWVWHNIDVSEKVGRGDVTRADFLAERNAEIRRVMAEIKGWAWVLDELGGVKGKTDEYGTMWRVALDDGVDSNEDNEFGWDEAPEEALLVDVLNSTPEPDGTIKRYLLSVDPDVCRDYTPADAIGWTFGLEPGQYRPQEMS